MCDITKNIHKKTLIRKKGTHPLVRFGDAIDYLSHVLNPSKRYLILGNVCVGLDVLIQLLTDACFEIADGYVKETDVSKDCQIIIMGNIGSDPHTIDFLHKNLLSDVPIHFIISELDLNALEIIQQTKIDDGRSDTYNKLKNKPELLQKFVEIHSLKKPFFRYNSADNLSRSFIVTHSKCESKYWCKLDRKSVRMQYSGHHNSSDNLIDDSCHMPYIVSCAPTNAYFTLNFEDHRLQIGSDKLTAVLLGYKLKNPNFFEDKRDLSNLFFKKFSLMSNSSLKESDIFEGLDEREVGRLKFLVQKKINFISGTIAPAGADQTTNNFESIAKGVEYFYTTFARKKINSKISIQPKYMGSRCNIYLYLDIARCYSTSRNGYLIQIDMQNIYQKLIDKLSPFMKENNIEMMLIDSELMPWNAMGKNLINKTFMPTKVCVGTALQKLNKYGFEELYDQLQTEMAQTPFATEITSMPHKDLYTKYGGGKFATYRALASEQKKHISLTDLHAYHQTYSTQLDIYAVEEEVHIKPFNILKTEKTDGTIIIMAHASYEPFVTGSKIWGQTDIFDLISNDEQCVLNSADPMEISIKTAEDFFNRLTADGKTEGVVLKPDFCHEDMASCMKVRNPNYLHIIYGLDYLHESRFPRLIASKNTSKKLSVSIKEYNLGVRMLSVKQSDISKDNLPYLKLLKDFLFLEKSEQSLDPRL